MKADEVQWTFNPDADRYRRLCRLLFQPDEGNQPPDMAGGER